MIKEMIPNVRVSNDARELILNCCTGGYSSSNSFTLEHIYNNYHRRWSSYCWIVSMTKLPWSHFLPSKSSTVRYSCISKSFYFETLAKHPLHDSDFVLLCIHCLVWWIINNYSLKSRWIVAINIPKATIHRDWEE